MSERYKAFENQAPYFITFTIVEWLPVLTVPEVSQIVIDSLKYCQANKGLTIYGYCIMPSHVHLIVQANALALGAIIRDMKKFTAYKIASFIKTEESLKHYYDVIQSSANATQRNKNIKVWLNGYHPEVIFSNKFFFQKLSYIHNNPVEAGLVIKAHDYYLSSARNYAGLNAPPDIVPESMEMTY